MIAKKLEAERSKRAKEMRGLVKSSGLTIRVMAERIGIDENTLARQCRGESGISEPVLRLARLIAEGKA